MKKTDIKCPQCRSFIHYRKVEFPYKEHYTNWRLDAECDCGPVRDPELMKQVKAYHSQVVGREIYAMQEAALARAIGHKGNDYFNKLICSSAFPYALTLNTKP